MAEAVSDRYGARLSEGTSRAGKGLTAVKSVMM